VHCWCCKQAAVPFLVITGPEGACVGCSAATLQCSFCTRSSTLQSRPLAASPSVLNADLVVQCLQARSLSIGGTPSTPSADSPTSGFVCLSGADSPMCASSVASHNSDVFDCFMEVSCVAATSGACKTMPWPCIRCRLSVNVRSIQFPSLLNQFIYSLRHQRKSNDARSSGLLSFACCA